MSMPGPVNEAIVWRAPGALYGFCPKCGAAGEMRERNDGEGRDRCQRKHTYFSVEALRAPGGVFETPAAPVKRKR